MARNSKIVMSAAENASEETVDAPQLEAPSKLARGDARPTKAEPEIVPIVKSVDVQKALVCIGGYNHAAIHSGDSLEIPAAGLPPSFSMDGVSDGYFSGAFVRRFSIVSHSRDTKTLKLKIKP